MGASISVTTANLTMEVVEQKALRSFSNRPKEFMRYVDDCFCVLKTSEVHTFLAHLNSIEPAIQFAVECEKDDTLPFLDAPVKQEGERVGRRQVRARQDQRSSEATQPRPIARISVSYVKGTLEALARVLRKEGIQVAHKLVSTLGRLMPRPKDRLPREGAQGVVYKIPCKECPATYIGEAKNFYEKMRQQNDVHNFDHERSAVAEHCEARD